MVIKPGDYQQQKSKLQTINEKTTKMPGISVEDANFSKTYILVAFAALLLGGIFGLLQALNRGGLINLPSWLNYYKILTAHGVLMVVVLMSFFTIGYFYAGMSNDFGGLLPKVRKFAWTGFALKIIGFVLAVIPIFAGQASVMYTFYPPMKASPMFYVGLALIVVGVWMCVFGGWIQVANWRKKNPGKHVPIMSFFATGVFVLLFFGSLPVAIEVIVMIIPWSFGWVDTINVLVARTLFWAFGHTLVNIWYLTATSAWYVVIPKIIGGKRWSDLLTRVVIISLVVMNITGGFHHQIIDPGIAGPIKFMHVFMSLAIGFPSLMTAYALFAVFERTARGQGGRGWIGWYKKMPWGDVRFLAPFIAMLSFAPAGAGGIAQSTNQLDQVVHNTMWIVGHFHLTLGMSVAMTFFGVSYWLVPYLSKRVITPQINQLGLIQTAMWTIGMVIMSTAMHTVGLFGSPRRTSFTTYFDNATALSWNPYMTAVVVGAGFLIIAVFIQVYNVINMMFFAPKGETEFPIAEAEEGDYTPYWTERWGRWVVLLIIIVAMAYVVPLTDMIVNAPPGSPGFKTW